MWVTQGRLCYSCDNAAVMFIVMARWEVYWQIETPVLWPPDVKKWLIWKDLDAGKDWKQEEKGRTEDEMVGWHHRLNGHEFEWTPGVGDGQGGLACCSPRGCKESDMTEWLNWIELNTKCMVWYIGIADIFDLIPKGRELIDPEILVNFCVYVYSFNFWPINFNLHALEIFFFP